MRSVYRFMVSLVFLSLGGWLAMTSVGQTSQRGLGPGGQGKVPD